MRNSGSSGPRPMGEWQSAAGVGVVSYAIVMALFAAFVKAEGDVSTMGMLALFGPRWIALVPWAPLFLLALVGRRWRVVVTAIFGVLFTLYAVVFFELPTLASRGKGTRALRLVTYNTDRSASLANRIRADLARWDADVVVLQDCKTIVGDTLKTLANVHVHTTSEFCLVSRFPVESAELMPTEQRVGAVLKGRPGHGTRYRVRTAQGVVPIYSVHLESPRSALWAARNGDLSGLARSIQARAADSRRTSVLVDRRDSVFVVAGDFNLPYGSAILQRDWGDLTNAFSAVGWGIGNTMFAGRFGVRIDHVLVSRSFRVAGVELLRGYPSEHQPVVATLEWR